MSNDIRQRSLIHAFAIAAAATAAVGVPGQAAGLTEPSCTLSRLFTPDEYISFATSLSDSGEYVAGAIETARTDDFTPPIPMIWHGEQWTQYPVQGENPTLTSVNDSGAAVGYTIVDDDQRPRAPTVPLSISSKTQARSFQSRVLP